MTSAEQIALIPEVFRTAKDSLPAESKIPLEQKRLTEIPPQSETQQRISKKTYESFYEEGVKFPGNIEEYPNEKRSLLEKHFPRFKEGGRQSLKNIPPVRIGAIFNKLMRYAENQIYQ